MEGHPNVLVRNQAVRLVGRKVAGKFKSLLLCFRDILHEFVGFNLSEHELITLIRHYKLDDKASPSLPKDEMHALIQVSSN